MNFAIGESYILGVKKNKFVIFCLKLSLIGKIEKESIAEGGEIGAWKSILNLPGIIHA